MTSMPDIRTAVLATLTSSGLLAAGCGGSSSEPLSKAELGKRADAICVKYNAKTKALGEPSDEAGYVKYFDKLIPLTRAQGKELKALKPDDAINPTWVGLLKAYDSVAAAAPQARAALKAGDVTEFQRIVEDANAASDAPNKQLDALGAPHCGSRSGA
jgi:hypothetical protein